MKISTKAFPKPPLGGAISLGLGIAFLLFAFGLAFRHSGPFLGLFDPVPTEGWLTGPTFYWFLLLIVIFIRGPHIVCSWWMAYANPAISFRGERNLYRRHLIYYPLIYLPLSFFVFFGFARHFEKMGDLFVLFFALNGPLFSFHSISHTASRPRVAVRVRLSPL